MPKGNFARGLAVVFTATALGGAMIGGVRGCSDQERAQGTLEKMGYKDVAYEGHPWVAFAGSKGDIFADEFSAIPPGGQQRVNVVVTRGIFKASTIRIAD